MTDAILSIAWLVYTLLAMSAGASLYREVRRNVDESKRRSLGASVLRTRML